jgi:hypothetical protein
MLTAVELPAALWEFGGLHETLAVNGIVNERANGSETGTGIENGAMTKHANGSESEMEIKNETF